MVRIFFLIVGFFSLALGIAGIFLPLLPTTPFLLLAAFSFSKSSDRFERWMIRHPRLGPPVLAWRERRAIPTYAKWFATVSMTVSLVVIHCQGRVPVLGQMVFAVFAVVLLVFVWTRQTH